MSFSLFLVPAGWLTPLPAPGTVGWVGSRSWNLWGQGLKKEVKSQRGQLSDVEGAQHF